MERPRIGAHLGVSGGFYRALVNGKEMGCECVQIFGASPRSYGASLPSLEASEKFAEAKKETGIERVYLHAAYLANPASDDAGIWRKSVANLVRHLEIGVALQAQGLIFHVGSAKTGDRMVAAVQVVTACKEILSRVAGDIFLIMENGAGGGGKIGLTPEEIGELLAKIDDPRMRVCWDTAHAYEAGVVMDYEKEIGLLVDRFEKSFGIERLLAMHINDSKTACGSYKDHHENIGDGYIGYGGFRAIAKEKRLWGADWILEVPGIEEAGPDKENVKRVQELF
ncbi:MAG: deoxyribonuclease IV [Candidatus Harrisonbacteria bacterium]|nr:deoxyribonuclease IV [Candidatus Harrisonbacteria bacterium]